MELKQQRVLTLKMEESKLLNEEVLALQNGVEVLQSELADLSKNHLLTEQENANLLLRLQLADTANEEVRQEYQKRAVELDENLKLEKAENKRLQEELSEEIVKLNESKVTLDSTLLEMYLLHILR